MSEKSAPPARTEEGLRLVTLGTGLMIEKGSEFETPPLGGGLDTVILAVPGATISTAEIVAVNSVLDTNTVGRGELFH